MSTNRFCLLSLGLSALVMAPAQAAVSPGAIPGGTASSGPAALRAFGAPRLPAAERGAGIYAKLDGSLIELWQRSSEVPATAALDRLHALNPAVRLRLHAPLALPEVLVDAVTRGDPAALRAALEGVGLEQAAVFANDVGGWLPVDRIAQAGALAELHALRASRPRTRSGAVTTQGDYAQRSDLLRTATSSGLSGSGIKVGVLSDSFNCFAYYQANGPSDYSQNGFTANYAGDVASGDLPSNVQVLEEADCGDYGAPQQLPFTDEGRAILQIVHDVAPGASLAFHTAFTSEADFANGIVQLAEAGAKVIDDDVGYPDEPVFQDGVLAQAVDQVEAQGVAYFSSAGNEGRNSYENAAPAFSGVAASNAPNAGEKLLNFDPSGASLATSLPLSIPALQPGEFLNLVVEWDQPFVTGAPDSGGSANALDLCYTDSSGANMLCSGPNQVGDDPVAIVTLGNPANASGNSAPMNINVMIGLASGAAPKLVKFLLEDDGAGSTINQFQTNSPTIQGHPGAAGAAAVGAAYYFQSPRCGTSPAVLETYSSAGGDPILFDVSGSRLSSPQTRQKPQFVGPDGVDNTFLGTVLSGSQLPVTSIAQCQDVAQYPSFFGTSAAAPHAAAAAALLLQAVPAATPTEIYNALQASAAPMGALNYDSGYGFIQVDGALGQLPASCGSSGGSSSSSSSGGCITSSGSGSGGGGGSIDPALMLVLGLLGLLRGSAGQAHQRRRCANRGL